MINRNCNAMIGWLFRLWKCYAVCAEYAATGATTRRGLCNGCGKNNRQATPHSKASVTQIRKKLGKAKQQFITVEEFADYTGINEELVRGFLVD